MAVRKTVYVDPEIFMGYRGVIIYHCYKNDCMDSGRRQYIYTVDKDEGGDVFNCFDVRKLPYFKAKRFPYPIERQAIRAAIRDAIDQGCDLFDGYR